jgi:beta-lactamase regulating signal transducer with metallopeptidase domain
MNISILETVVKISVVMALAAVVAGLMRRRASAASRHLVWTLATIAVLAIPLAAIVMPGLPIPIQRASAPVGERASAVSPDSGDVAPQATPAATASSIPVRSWPALLPMFYAAGVIVLLGRLAVEQWRVRALLSRTTVVDDSEWTTLLRDCTVRVGLTREVRLVRSREETMPMTVGIRRPVIVIPSMAEMWDRDRRRAVLLHELAHVARLDCLTQTLAEIAVAVYWPHPGAWLMARRLRVERELACDDCVLSSGTEPRDYAGHLLEIAHSLGDYRAPALVVSMARPRQLEGRMLAMLDATRNRATPAASRRLLAIALTAMAMAPLAAATTVTLPSTPPAAAPQPAAASAAVQDRVASSLTPGTWQIRVAADGKSAQLTVSTHAHSFHSMSIPLNRVEGLAALLAGPAGPVHYSVTREAGTFDFEGTQRSGVGGGTFTFGPSAAFSAELVRRGFGKPTLEEQQALAGADIGFAYVDELARQKYTRPTLAQLVNAALHGVSMTYIREMSALGYRLGTLDALIRQRDHGIDPQFIRDLQAQGSRT